MLLCFLVFLCSGAALQFTKRLFIGGDTQGTMQMEHRVMSEHPNSVFTVRVKTGYQCECWLECSFLSLSLFHTCSFAPSPSLSLFLCLSHSGSHTQTHTYTHCLSHSDSLSLSQPPQCTVGLGASLSTGASGRRGPFV